MRRHSRRRVSQTISAAVALGLSALGVVACGGSDTTALGLIQEQGFLGVATDVSYVLPDGQRTAETHCPSTLLTASQLAGFDISVAAALASQMGVEPCFATPPFETLLAGNWNGQWDVGINSITITTPRQQVLAFTAPYYYTTAQVAAARDAGITAVADLAGQRVCAGAGTTYALWLSDQLGALGLPAAAILTMPPPNITVVAVDTDTDCGAAIANGTASFPAYLTSNTIVAADIGKGLPVVSVGTAVFIESLGVAVDRTGPRAEDLQNTLDVLLGALRSMGTLRQLSLQWFGADLTNPPS